MSRLRRVGSVRGGRSASPTWRFARKQLLRTLVLRVPLLLYGIFVLGPIYWVIRTAFMSDADAIAMPLKYFPIPFTTDAFVLSLRELDLIRIFSNSLFTGMATCLLSLFLVILTSYGLSRYDFHAKVILMILLILTQMVPQVMIMIPYFVIFSGLGLVDTLWSIIIIQAIGSIPFSALMLKQFFDQVTREIDDAARIDGCGRLGVIFRVVMPLIVPGIVSITIFNFIGSWNNLMLPVIMLNDPDKMTLPARLILLRDQYTFSWALHAAGGVVNLIPAIVLFAIIQRHLISGLAAGAVKG